MTSSSICPAGLEVQAKDISILGAEMKQVASVIGKNDTGKEFSSLHTSIPIELEWIFKVN